MPDQSKIYIFATIAAAPGHGPALRQALEPLVTATREEPGNLQYDLYEPLGAPGTFLVYEAYRDRRRWKRI